MKKIILISCIATLLCACQPKSSDTASNPSSAAKPTVPETSIKTFTPTSQDTQDIAVLDKFNADFIQMSKEMQQELEQLKKQNNLQDSFVKQRQRDQALSALNMIKDLELNTAQGHYIQGMLYDYWDQKVSYLQQEKPAQAPNKNIINQAEQQLEHWKKDNKKA